MSSKTLRMFGEIVMRLQISSISFATLTLLYMIVAAPTHAASADIIIGQSIALTGGNGQHGTAITQGIDSYLEQVNARGGVKGHKIRLLREDDAGDSKRAAENTLKFVEKDRAVAIFSGIEGGPCVAITQAISAKQVPIIGCAAGSPDLREPYNRYSFPIRAAHFSEFAKLIDIALSYGYKRFAFMHSDSDTGRKHLTNVKRLLGERQTPSCRVARPRPKKSQSFSLTTISMLFSIMAQPVFMARSYRRHARPIATPPSSRSILVRNKW
jgi:ABC-type branched-subunit amino acid transport system substrate-binding protein